MSEALQCFVYYDEAKRWKFAKEADVALQDGDTLQRFVCTFQLNKNIFYSNTSQ